MKSVLVVEKSPDLLRLLCGILPCIFPDWRIIAAGNLEEADHIQQTQLLSLAIVDMDFGGSPSAGIELLHQWKRNGVRFPIVASTSYHSHLSALWETEPDDILIKPWDILEIRVRLARAVNFWSRPSAPGTRNHRVDGVPVGTIFQIAGATVENDFTCRMPDGHVLKLGVKEYGILSSLHQARGKLLLRDELLGAIWGADANSDSNSLHVYMSRLRRNFSDHGGTFDKDIVTVAKIGWRVAAPTE